MRLSNLVLLVVVSSSILGCLKTRSELTQMRSQQEAQVQQQQAQQEIKEQEVNEQIRNMTGRLEVMENQLSTVMAQLQEKKGPTEEESKAKADKDRKLELLEQAVEKMDLRLMALSNEIKVYLKSKSTSKKAKSSPKKGNFTRAEEAFKAKKWKEAIVGYEKYRELNPKGRRYALSTYKIGVCFQELSMPDAAKSFYQEVIDKYSKTPEAKKAKYRLSKLK